MLLQPFKAARTLLAVMSYNRGIYLKNCMQSIERHLPGFKATVFDDHSTCNETRRVLDQVSTRHRVVDCKAGAAGDRGGLHPNMNRALELAIGEGFEYVLFLQDDMQFVRDVDQDLVDNVNATFASDEQIAQVNVMFFKGYWPKRIMQDRIGINHDIGYYYHRRVAGWNCGIADSGITSLAHVRAHDFRYEDSEAGSIVKAESFGMHRADCRDPILMFTPWPGTTRRLFDDSLSLKKIVRNLLIKLQEHGAGTGCHPFHTMAAEAVRRLKERPIEDYPIAERFLAVERDLLKPWWYSASSNLSDFKSLRSLCAFEWYTKGPPNYRANVRRQRELDEQFQVESLQGSHN